MSLFAALIPIIVFALVDAFSANIRWAIAVAVCFALAEFFLLYASSGVIDPITLLAVALFIVLGFYSAKTENRIYFKLQPALLSFITAGFFAYMQFFGTPLTERYLPAVLALLPAEFQAASGAEFATLVDKIMSWMVVVIAAEGVWITYAALRCQQWVWVFVNIFGIWILAGTLLVTQLLTLYLSSS